MHFFGLVQIALLNVECGQPTEIVGDTMRLPSAWLIFNASSRMATAKSISAVSTRRSLVLNAVPVIPSSS